MTESDFLPSKLPWENDELWMSLTAASKWQWFKRFHKDFVHPIEKIAEGCVSVMVQDWPHASGVYFLFLRDELMYVGETWSFSERVEKHFRPNRPSLRPANWFDSVAFVYAPKDFSEYVEGHYINTLNPPRNVKAGKAWNF